MQGDGDVGFVWEATSGETYWRTRPFFDPIESTYYRSRASAMSETVWFNDQS
jgi:hypothetical protein